VHEVPVGPGLPRHRGEPLGAHAELQRQRRQHRNLAGGLAAHDQPTSVGDRIGGRPPPIPPVRQGRQQPLEGGRGQPAALPLVAGHKALVARPPVAAQPLDPQLLHHRVMGVVRVDGQHRLRSWRRWYRWPAAAPGRVGIGPAAEEAIEGWVGVRHESEHVVKGPVFQREQDHMVHSWWHRSHLHKPGKRPNAIDLAVGPVLQAMTDTRTPYFTPDGSRRPAQTRLGTAVGRHLLARRKPRVQIPPPPPRPMTSGNAGRFGLPSAPAPHSGRERLTSPPPIHGRTAVLRRCRVEQRARRWPSSVMARPGERTVLVLEERAR
jgi:hypothetical protein